LAGLKRVLSSRPDRVPASGIAQRQRKLLPGVVAVALGLIGTIAWVALGTRQAAMDHATQMSENLASALSHDIARNIEVFDLSLQAVGERLRLPEIWTVSPELRGSILFDRSTTAKYLGAIIVFDEKGNAILRSGTPAPQGSVADDPAFLHHRDDSDLGLVISPPFKSPATGEWSIGLTHRLEHPDGSFAGMVRGTIRLDYFQHLFDEIDLGPDGTVTLMSADGTLIQRKPMAEKNIGRPLRNAFGGSRSAQMPAGRFEAVAGIDGVRRVYIYRQVGNLPLAVSVGFGKTAALAEWRHRAIVNATVIAGLMTMTAFLFTGFMRELRRRGRAEIAALESNKRYRLLADHSSDVIFRWGLDGIALYVSPAVREVLGYEIGEIVGTKTMDLAHADDVERTRTVAHAMAAGLDRSEITCRFRHRDGRWLWADVTMRLVRDEQTGDPVEIVGSLRDGTTRQEASEAMRRSEAMFRLLADHSSDMICLSDPKSQTRYYVSPASRQLFGWEPEEIVGRSNTDFVNPEDFLPGGRKGYQGLLVATGRARFSYRFLCKDGGYVWVEASLTLTTNPETGAPAVVTVLRDISERVRQEQSLRAAKHQADIANLAKSEFLANMSHEIRTPMNGILGMNGLLLQTALDETQRGYAEMVRDSGASLLVIIDDILDISKLEAGKVELESIEFDLLDTVEAAAAILVPKVEAKGIGLSVSIDPAVPRAVCSDPTRLRQILLNLLGNAVKFTDRGAVSLAVSLVAPAQDASETCRLRFVVSDTGIGMTEDGSTKLFQKFHQADTSVTRRFGGTGLGLAISSQLVALLGGTIGVTSQPGAGSSFWFELPLPLARSAAPDRPSIAAAPASGVAAAGGDAVLPPRPLRVLLAEDNEINQLLAVAILQHAGHAVDVAENGRRAVEAVQRSDYDVVLMDVQMPELDGMQATQQIRALESPRSKVAIIALTAHAMAGAREQYLAAGMDDYITKPIDAACLLAKLSDLAIAIAARAQAGAASVSRDASYRSVA
jgi:PAS domain S-box-containing protein